MSPNVMKLLADALLEFAEKLQWLASEAESGNGLAQQPAPEPPTDESAPEQPAPPPEAAKEPPPQPTIMEEDVRLVLAAKARDGFTKNVKEIIAKYGAAMVSELDPAHYAAVIKEAEAIK